MNCCLVLISSCSVNDYFKHTNLLILTWFLEKKLKERFVYMSIIESKIFIIKYFQSLKYTGTKWRRCYLQLFQFRVRTERASGCVYEWGHSTSVLVAIKKYTTKCESVFWLCYSLIYYWKYEMWKPRINSSISSERYMEIGCGIKNYAIPFLTTWPNGQSSSHD